MRLIYSNSRDVLPIRRRYASALVAAGVRPVMLAATERTETILGKPYSEDWIRKAVRRHECGSTEGLVAAAAQAMNRMAAESPKHARPAEERQAALAAMFEKNGMPVPAWVWQA
jgi:hypothetical protein